MGYYEEMLNNYHNRDYWAQSGIRDDDVHVATYDFYDEINWRKAHEYIWEYFESRGILYKIDRCYGHRVFMTEKQDGRFIGLVFLYDCPYLSSLYSICERLSGKRVK